MNTALGIVTVGATVVNAGHLIDASLNYVRTGDDFYLKWIWIFGAMTGVTAGWAIGLFMGS